MVALTIDEQRELLALMRQLAGAKHGYTVLRFWDNEVLQNTESVVERIAAALASLTPTLSQRETEQE